MTHSVPQLLRNLPLCEASQRSRRAPRPQAPIQARRRRPRVEQPTACKIRPRSGALVAQPSYPLLVLNNYSADSNKLTGHRKHA